MSISKLIFPKSSQRNTPYLNLPSSKGLKFATSVVFNNSLYVIGGLTTPNPQVQNSGISKKVFSSPDGMNWQEVGTDALSSIFPNTSDGLYNVPSTVFNNKIWVLNYDGRLFNSQDGITWNIAQTGLGYNHRSLEVFNNKLWIDGIKYSTDGINFQTGTTPPCIGQEISFNNWFLRIGGQEPTSQQPYSCYTTDGVTWMLLGPTNIAPIMSSILSYSYSDRAVVFNNKMWILTPFSYEDSYDNTLPIFSSDNGSHLNSYPEQSPASGVSFVVFNNKLLIIGGQTPCLNPTGCPLGAPISNYIYSFGN